MSLRRWVRDRIHGTDAVGDDLPPRAALLNTILGRTGESAPPSREFTSDSFPPELSERLSRREQVARELIQLDVTQRSKRVAAIPRLRELLAIYPHPLAYETLIQAYLDAGRFDEARGVAFAARQRRLECAAAEHASIRAEIESLREWSSAEIDALEREGASG